MTFPEDITLTLSILRSTNTMTLFVFWLKPQHGKGVRPWIQRTTVRHYWCGSPKLPDKEIHKNRSLGKQGKHEVKGKKVKAYVEQEVSSPKGNVSGAELATSCKQAIGPGNYNYALYRYWLKSNAVQCKQVEKEDRSWAITDISRPVISYWLGY